MRARQRYQELIAIILYTTLSFSIVIPVFILIKKRTSLMPLDL